MQKSTAEDLKEVAKWQQDSEYFFKEILGIHPWEKQIEIAESVRDHERTIVPAAFGVGKTYISAAIVIQFLCSYFPSKVITTASTARQVRDLLWREIRNIHKKSLVPIGGRLLTQVLEFDEDWYAVGFTTDEYDPDKFTGYHSENVLVVFDQASGIPKSIWTAAEGLMTSAFCRWLAIGNCTSSDSEFFKNCKPNSGWNRIHITAFDSPNVKAGKNIYPGIIAHDYPKKKAEQWGKESILYQMFVMAEFPREGTDNLISYYYVEKALLDKWNNGDPVEIGVDPAEYGDDKTILVARRGYRIVEIEVHSKQDIMVTTGNAIQMAHRLAEPSGKDPKRIPIKVDTIGVGSGIPPRLREQGYRGIDVKVSENPADKDTYENLRAELAFNLKDRFINEEIGVSSDIPAHIIEEWEADTIEPKYSVNSKGKYVLEPKEKIKKRLKRSPDYFEGTMLAFAPTKQLETEISYQSVTQRRFSSGRRAW
jgi:phage terminase large subunit